MSERHPRGFLQHGRKPIGLREPQARIGDYREIYKAQWIEAQVRQQGERCMDCGMPACMGGCPIGNIIPDWNDLVHRGNWREALARLHATNNFPEFTGYTCPAPCESACTLAINTDPVTIKSIERAIVDRGWEAGWIVAEPPAARTGFSVAVVGSGPAGLAAAQQLNRAGHLVTVLERDDAIGGLMTYGIPDFKFAKHQVARRVDQLRGEGIRFETGVDVGTDITLDKLRGEFDAVCLCIGAQSPRKVEYPGVELAGIVPGMDYLTASNRRQAGQRVAGYIDAKGRNVAVMGGGDTGADCVATALRQRAAQVLQISIRDQPPMQRSDDNPWPERPMTYLKTYAQEEGGQELFGINTTAFLDTRGDGRVGCIQAERVEWTYDANGRRLDKRVVESGIEIPADLVLIAIGFSGPDLAGLGNCGLQLTPRSTFQVDARMMTSLPGVFAAGDARRGQSIVVWAIGEGRDVARNIDLYLTGSTQLPPSLATHNPPIE